MFRASAMLAFPLLTLSLVIPSAATESLVGTWAAPGECGRPLSTVAVEPMSFSGEDFSCDFASTFGVDTENNVVIARLSKGMLSYRFDRQGWNGRLRGCS